MKKTTLNNLEYLDISQEINALQRPSTPFLSWLLGAGKPVQQLLRRSNGVNQNLMEKIHLHN
ncbi:hypothetical protein ACTND8_11175 [Atopobiaceae bacterium HCP3S3_F7]